MKPNYPHYLQRLEDATRKFWNKPALNTIGGDSFTYAQMATDIARFHIIFVFDTKYLTGKSCKSCGSINT